MQTILRNYLELHGTADLVYLSAVKLLIIEGLLLTKSTTADRY